jgi:hypothetical protein
MVVRITRILAAAAVMALFTNMQPAVCHGWSLLHPFSSDATTNTKTKKMVVKPVKKQQPSTLDKLAAGTKNFFNKTGETLGLKKPETKKPTVAYPKASIQSQKKDESKSWLGSMFKPAEPKKPTSVSEWIGQPRQDP